MNLSFGDRFETSKLLLLGRKRQTTVSQAGEMYSLSLSRTIFCSPFGNGFSINVFIVVMYSVNVLFVVVLLILCEMRNKIRLCVVVVIPRRSQWI